MLVTRAAADAEALCAGLRAEGLEPVVVPLLERVYHDDAVRSVLGGDFDGWVLTSAAAVEALVRAGAERRPRWIAAVGPRTAAAARRRGLGVDHVPAEATAACLAESLGDLRGQRVLYPRADLAPAASLEALRATGASVVDVVAYDNREPEGVGRALRAAWPTDLVVLLSGSAARRLAAHVPPPWPDSVRTVVIGPSTAAVAAEVGILVHAVATPHTVQGTVAAIRGVRSPAERS